MSARTLEVRCSYEPSHSNAPGALRLHGWAGGCLASLAWDTWERQHIYLAPSARVRIYDPETNERLGSYRITRTGASTHVRTIEESADDLARFPDTAVVP